MQIEVEITKNDEIVLNKYYFKKDRTLGSKTFLLIVGLVVFFGIGGITVICIQNKMEFFTTLLIIGALLLPILFYFFLPFLSTKISTLINIFRLKYIPSKNVKWPYKCTYKITEDGLHGSSNFGVAKINWNEIKKLDSSNEYIFITSEKYGTHIIPKRYFNSISESEKFLNILKEGCKL